MNFRNYRVLLQNPHTSSPSFYGVFSVLDVNGGGGGGGEDSVVHSHMDLNNLITMQRNLLKYTLSNFNTVERCQKWRICIQICQPTEVPLL